MRKLLFILFAALFVSCSSDSDDVLSGTNEGKPEAKLYDVAFNVSAFTQSFEDIEAEESKAGKSLDGINHILCTYFDSSGDLVKSVVTDRTQSGFGTISIQLPLGKYSMYVIAGTVPVLSFRNSTVSLFSFDHGILFNSGKNIFHKAIEFTVSSDAMQEEIILSRLAGEIEVVATDAVPQNANVNSVEVEVSLLSQYFPLINNTQNWFGFGQETFVDHIRGESNVSLLSTVDFGMEGLSHTVTIKVYDQTRNVLSAKTIKNVVILPNKRNIVKGKIFDGLDGDVSKNIIINADQNWDSEDNIMEF